MTDTRSIKLAALQNYTNEIQADICAITECNVDWKHGPMHLYHLSKQDSGVRTVIGA